jgi:hypothetical protein
MKAPTLSVEEFSNEITRLHPAANELDTLQDPSLIHDPGGPILKLTPANIQSAVKSLDKKSAPGSTGWSNLLIAKMAHLIPLTGM